MESIRKSHPFKPEACRRLEPETMSAQRTMTYVKCNECGGGVEIWSDEEKGVCLNLGTEWARSPQP